jgi:hypothetical protein
MPEHPAGRGRRGATQALLLAVGWPGVVIGAACLLVWIVGRESDPHGDLYVVLGGIPLWSIGWLLVAAGSVGRRRPWVPWVMVVLGAALPVVMAGFVAFG